MKQRGNPALIIFCGLTVCFVIGWTISHRTKSVTQDNQEKSLVKESLRKKQEALRSWENVSHKIKRDVDAKFKKEGVNAWCSKNESVKTCLEFLTDVKSNPELKKSLQAASRMVPMIFLGNSFIAESEGILIDIHASPEEIIRRL